MIRQILFFIDRVHVHEFTVAGLANRASFHTIHAVSVPSHHVMENVIDRSTFEMCLLSSLNCREFEILASGCVQILLHPKKWQALRQLPCM